MPKPKFTYEVKDFEPTIRRKPMSLVKRLLIGIIVCVLIFVSGLFIYRHYFGKEKLPPEERVKAAVKDTLSAIAGKNSYISKKAELEDWYDIVHEGVFDAELNLKIKEMKDFGIGIENLASGIGLTVKTTNDSAQGLSTGKVFVSWTVVALDILQYVYDGSAFYLSSSDFFKENFRLDPKNTKLLDLSAKEIAESYLGDYLSEEELEKIGAFSLSGLALKDLLRQTKPEIQYEALDGKETLTINDKNVECDIYRVTIKEELTGDSIVVLLYIDDKDRLLEAVIKAPHVDYIDISFTGESRPVDKIYVKAGIEIGETKLECGINISITDSSERMTLKAEGSLNLPDIALNGIFEMNYFYEDSSFNFCFVAPNDVNIEVYTEGSMTKDKENLKFKFDDISLKVDHEEYIVFGGNLNLKVSDKKLTPGEHPGENIVDVENINREVIDSVVEQIKKRIEDYKDLIKDFGFIK